MPLLLPFGRYLQLTSQSQIYDVTQLSQGITLFIKVPYTKHIYRWVGTHYDAGPSDFKCRHVFNLFIYEYRKLWNFFFAGDFILNDERDFEWFRGSLSVKSTGCGPKCSRSRIDLTICLWSAINIEINNRFAPKQLKAPAVSVQWRH